MTARNLGPRRASLSQISRGKFELLVVYSENGLGNESTKIKVALTIFFESIWNPTNELCIVIRTANNSQKVPSELICGELLVRLRKIVLEHWGKPLGIWCVVVVQDGFQDQCSLEPGPSAVEGLGQVFHEKIAATKSTCAWAVSRQRTAHIGLRLTFFKVKGHKQESMVTWTF